jgi:inversin
LKESVLKENSALMDSPDYFGRTPMMYCVLADRLNTAKLLLRLGAQVSSVDNVGRSAAHIAAHKGSIKFLQLLAAKNCQFSLPDKEGQTPLHLARVGKISLSIGKGGGCFLANQTPVLFA